MASAAATTKKPKNRPLPPLDLNGDEEEEEDLSSDDHPSMSPSTSASGGGTGKESISSRTPSSSNNSNSTGASNNNRVKGKKSPRELEMNKVQEELEKLNIATDVINKLELQLDDARSAFAEIQSSWTQQLEKLTKKLGNCIEKSRPYYEARLQSRQIQEEAQKAALRFERANSMHAVAKQQVSLTQDSLNRQDPKDVDPACLEVLNHHVQRVNEAERERINSEEEHRRISQLVEEASRRVVTLEKELGRQIKKSKIYFDRRLEFTRVLEEQKSLIQRIELEVKQKKVDYQTSLKNLEKISERIHAERKLGRRESGVGAESEPSDTKESPSDRMPPTSPKVKDLLRTMSNNSEESAKLRAKSEPPDPALLLRQDDLQQEKRKRTESATGGVLLIAQQLQEYGWLPSDKQNVAFTFPPEDLDVSYKTVPEGVKMLPTPPETPTYKIPPVALTIQQQPPTELGVGGLNLLSPRPETSIGCPSSSNRSSDTASIGCGVQGNTSSRMGCGGGGAGHGRNPSLTSDISLGELSDGSSLGGLSMEEGKLNGMLRSHTAMIQEIHSTADRIKTHVSDLPQFDRSSASGESSTGN